MKKVILGSLIILTILNIYLFKVAVAKSASEQTDSNPVFTKVIGQTQNTNPGNGDISSCQFYRGNFNPPGGKYQSPTLIGYFEEASKLSGVPASVLAAITRIETPNLTSLTDQTLSSYTCSESPDGALGPMQIVSPASPKMNPAAVCTDCIDVGAKFLGKTRDQLTREDYCGLRSGIILGAGFVLKKMQLSYGLPNPTWDPSWTTSEDAIANKLAHDYYGGSLEYGGGYSYGTDLWNSVSQCKETTPTPTGPVSNGSSPLANAARDLIISNAQNCNGSGTPDYTTTTINSGNYQCMTNNIPTSLPNTAAAIAAIISSTTVSGCYDPGTGIGYGCRYQCVGLIQTVLEGVLGTGLDGRGAAKNYANYPPPPGFSFISASEPVQAGDIIVYNEGTFGHIAWAVNSYDDVRFDQAESNFNYLGGTRIKTVVRTPYMAVLRKQ